VSPKKVGRSRPLSAACPLRRYDKNNESFGVVEGLIVKQSLAIAL
jgi:hypothetical protein